MYWVWASCLTHTGSRTSGLLNSFVNTSSSISINNKMHCRLNETHKHSKHQNMKLDGGRLRKDRQTRHTLCIPSSWRDSITPCQLTFLHFYSFPHLSALFRYYGKRTHPEKNNLQFHTNTEINTDSAEGMSPLFGRLACFYWSVLRDADLPLHLFL